MPSKREDFDKPETAEEREARLKARKERSDKQKEEQDAALAEFDAKVDAVRPKVQKRLCPTCREVGSYAGLVRGQHETYIVSFRCSINHHWSVTVGKLEAHALRLIGMDDEPGRPIARVSVVPKPTEPPPLVPDPEPLPLAEGTPTAQPLVPDVIPEVVREPAPVLTSGPVCGSCSGPLGTKYYAGVPTAGGKLDLCMTCWDAWPGRKR